MWIKDPNNDLVNIAQARTICISDSDANGDHQVIAIWDPDRTNGQTVLFEGDRDHCEAFMLLIGNGLKALGSQP